MFRIFTAALLIAMPLAAGGQQGKAKGHGRHGAHGGPPSVAVVHVFVGHDRRAIHDYIAGYPGGGLPPGLAKRGGSLPPGLEKQLRRNGRLPPGLEKRITYFPPELERRLSPLAPGLRRGFIGGRAVVYNPKSSVVLDVFAPLDN